MNTFAFAEWQKRKLSANHWSQMKFKCRTLVKANINSSDRKKGTKKMYALLKIVWVGKPYGKSYNFGKGKMFRYCHIKIKSLIIFLKLFGFIEIKIKHNN